MDDMHSPASPFMPRADVEAEAARLLGEMDNNRERHNAAEIAFVEQWVGTKFNDDDMPPLAVATAFSKAAIKVMWETRQLLSERGISRRRMNEAMAMLNKMIPPGYGE